MPITSVSASLSLETEETIRACLEVALRLSSDDVFAAADCIEKYRLEPAAFPVLLRRLETDPRIFLLRLHLEYRPQASSVSFEMPQSPLDPIVARLFSNTASSVAGDIIPKVQQFRNHFVSLPPPQSDPDSCEYGSIRRYTNVAWYANVKNSTDFPRVVSTISSTQSSSFEELQKKCIGFVSLSEIHIGAIVAMKIQLDRKAPKNSVERPLYEWPYMSGPWETQISPVRWIRRPTRCLTKASLAARGISQSAYWGRGCQARLHPSPVR